MIARRWCCRWMERRPRWVLAFGVLGMISFVGSLAAVAAGWLRIGGSLGAMSASLAAYAVSLLIGHLGDPFELHRRDPLEGEPAPSPRASQAPGVWWPVGSCRKLDRTAGGWAS